MSHCLYCHQSITRNHVGRSPVYCSKSCKQAAYRFRQNGFKRVRVSASCRSLSLLNVSQSLPLRNAAGTAYKQTDFVETFGVC